MILEGWGRYPRFESDVLNIAKPAELASILGDREGVIARGNGRAYGDAAIGGRATLMCRGISRMKHFDPDSRRLTVESGTLLSDILEAFIPRGFFPPVVPGTKLVTVGGMVASDVHGKNHHREGGFGNHVHGFRLALPTGEVVNCSRDENSELFFATIGGMGLTGVILDVTMTMKPVESGWIRQETTVANNLVEAIDALERTDQSTYSVAWIDCLARGASLGRSLVFSGEHAGRQEVLAERRDQELFPSARQGRLTLPLDFPGWLLNRASVSAFNEAYFRAGVRKARAVQLVHWNPYFFPLDAVGEWNRLYGRRGFLQHQCVVPQENAQAVLSDILGRFAASGKASFLAVLKKLGSGTGLLSFPLPGYTLALDLPVSETALRLLDEIDKVVVEAGGRLYLAKDARQSRQTFEAGYPQLDRFRELRRGLGADRRFASQLATRLGL